MQKLHYVLLGFAAFLIVLTSVVVSSQGGLLSISLTSEQAATSSQFNETLPIQMTGLTQGASLLIGGIMMMHVLIANIGVGGSWISVITKRKFNQTHEEKYDKLAKSVTHFNVILFSIGSTFAFFGVTGMIGMFPGAIGEIFHIFFWPLILEAISFIVEICFIYPFYYTWGKISNRWHLFLGFGYAISVIFQTGFIDMIASGMLTPGTSISYTGSGVLTMSLATLFSWWFNPTFLVLTVHTFVAAISYVGFVFVMLAMFHYNDKKYPEAKSYWDWVGSYGMAWGLGGLIFQPIVGMVYAQVIENVEMTSFDNMMHGSLGWEFLLMVGLFSVLFLTILIYFVDREELMLSKPENAFLKKMFNVFLLITAISAFFLCQPAWFNADNVYDPSAIINPLGLMSFKYIALFVMILIGLITFIVIQRLNKVNQKEAWGKLSQPSRMSGFVAGIVGMWLVVVMGFIRESDRAPYIINQIIPMMANPVPISITSIFIIWVVITTVAFFLFWIASKASMYRPANTGKTEVTQETEETYEN